MPFNGLRLRRRFPTQSVREMNSSEGQSRENTLAARILVTLGAIGAIGLVLTCGALGIYYFQFRALPFGNPAAFASFGDYFGGVSGAIFAPLGFVALLVTIYVQLAELEQTRRELATSATALSVQAFEGAFFQMLRLHHEIVRGVSRTASPAVIGGHTSILEGRIVLAEKYTLGVQIAYEQRCFAERRSSRTPAKEPAERELVADAVAQYFHGGPDAPVEGGDQLSHYFAHLHEILLLISNAPPDAQQRYANILGAQLSDDELLLLFYYCVSADVEALPQATKTRELVERWSLLTRLPHDRLIHAQHGAYVRHNLYVRAEPAMAVVAAPKSI